MTPLPCTKPGARLAGCVRKGLLEGSWNNVGEACLTIVGWDRIGAGKAVQAALAMMTGGAARSGTGLGGIRGGPARPGSGAALACARAAAGTVTGRAIGGRHGAGGTNTGAVNTFRFPVMAAPYV